MARRRVIPQRFTWKRSLAVLAVGLLFGAAVLWALIQPLRPILAGRYVQRGDTFLATQEFSDAQREYRQALKFEPGNADAASRLGLATRGQTDPALLRQFYQDHAVLTELSKLDRAQAGFATPKDALAAGALLYSAGDYPYARYALEKAVEMDPQYAEAWDWLARDYGQLAKLDSGYAAKEKEAEGKRDSLTTTYIGQ